MALVHLLKPGEFLPAGNYNNSWLAVFQIIPSEFDAWRMFAGQTAGWSIMRGRFVNKDANLVNISVDIASGDGDGNAALGVTAGGLEATILTVTGTSIVNANTWMMPFVRLKAHGSTAANASDARVILGLGFPVEKFRCLWAVPGLPWRSDDDLLRMVGRVDVW